MHGQRVKAIRPACVGGLSDMATLQNLGLQGAGEGGATAAPQNPAEAERCKVPAFAKTIGQKILWKQHNNCS